MPYNPCRAAQGGDVGGETETDVDGAVGAPITVARASYDPGYPFGESLDYETPADLKAGFCSYGVAVGDARGKGYIGGRK
jgi:hypothetical protein